MQTSESRVMALKEGEENGREKVSGGALCALIVILIRNRDLYWSSQLSIAMFDSQRRVSVKKVTKEKR